MNNSVVSDSDKKCCPSCSDSKDAGMTGSEAEPIKTIENWYRMKKSRRQFHHNVFISIIAAVMMV